MFTEQDFKQILNHFQTADPHIYDIMMKHGYLKPLPKRNLFSVLVGAILGQKIKFYMARNLRRNLYTLLKTDDFTPADILSVSKQDLLNLNIGQNITDLIFLIAQKIENKDIQLNTVNDVKKLNKIKGIGPWTINNTIIIHTMNEGKTDDVLLFEDLIIRRGIKKLYNKTTKQEVEDLSKIWKPYRGIVTWYLWKEFT